MGLIVAAAASSGADAPNPAASPDQILHALIGPYQGIDGVRFEISKKVDVFDSTGKDTGKGYVETLTYAGRGGKYKYTYTSKTGGPGTDDVYTKAFDGTHSYCLNQSNGELVISSSKSRDQFLSNMQGVFEPFAFLLAGHNDGTPSGAMTFPTLQDYQNPTIWAAFVKQLAGSKVVKHGTMETICLTVPGGVMPWRACQTSFKVYLSPKDHYFPIAWERAANDGNFRYVYEVKHLQPVRPPAGGAPVDYPQKATMEKYIGQAKTPITRAYIDVKNVSVGGVKDEDLTIDPKQAKFITDQTLASNATNGAPK